MFRLYLRTIERAGIYTAVLLASFFALFFTPWFDWAPFVARVIALAVLALVMFVLGVIAAGTSHN